jgi:hypothetical protein
MSAKLIVGQDVDAHLFYDVDWECWLTARGFLADGSQISSVGFTVDAPATKTFEEVNAAVARVGVSGVPLNTNIKVVARITMPEPSVGAGSLIDDFTFILRGTEK